MNLQVGILVALAAIIACGALLPRINVGILALVTTFLFGTLGSGLGVQDILGAFPIRLAFLIVGLSLFFGMLADNGTIERIAAFALRLVRGRALLVPLVVFALTALLTTAGVSNIAVTALVAPLAMKLAKDVGLSPFLMTLIVVGAASGASFSPVSLSGVITLDFVTRESQALGHEFSFAPWRLFLFSFFGHGVVTFAGFHLFGGTAWLRSRKGVLARTEGLAHQPLERIHVISLVVFALFIAAVVLPGLPGLKDMMPASVRLLTENVAVPALLCVALLMLLGVGSVSRGLALVPWSTLVLIVGMSTLIDFAGRYDALSVLSRRLVDFASASDWPPRMVG